jgi:hypothetical protein
LLHSNLFVHQRMHSDCDAAIPNVFAQHREKISVQWKKNYVHQRAQT